jgi:hypothetical protein
MARGFKTGGRTKGTKNKPLLIQPPPHYVGRAHARAVIQNLVNDMAPKLEDVLRRIERKHGVLASFECFAKLMEFALPKLQRTELVGEGGGPLTLKVVNYGDQAAQRLGSTPLPAPRVDSP